MPDTPEPPADAAGTDPTAEIDYRPKPPGETDPERLRLVTRRLRSGAMELSPRRAELKRLADASRLLTTRLVGTDAPDDVVRAAAEHLEQAAALFEGYAQGSSYGFSERAIAGSEPDPMFDHSPILGIANPLAPPMRLSEEEGVVVATVTMGQAYEGPPGCVHGGYIAALFDELLGAAQSLSGAPGMTGTLKIRYESPTPLHTELRLEGRLVDVERRKIFTEGVCMAGDVVTARAEGIFISLDASMFRAMIGDRMERQEEQR